MHTTCDCLHVHDIFLSYRSIRQNRFVKYEKTIGLYKMNSLFGTCAYEIFLQHTFLYAEIPKFILRFRKSQSYHLFKQRCFTELTQS